jgi:hypothetical protein
MTNKNLTEVAFLKIHYNELSIIHGGGREKNMDN